jgi:hypothetical protein
MDSLKSRWVFFLAAVTVLLVLFVSAPVGAGDLNWKLKGKYAWTSSATCATASCGFDMSKQVPGPGRILTPCQGPLGPANPATGISYNYAIQGDLSFDGHGNFEFLNGEVLSIMLEPYRSTPDLTSSNFTAPIHHFESVGDGIYTVELKGDELFVEIVFEHFTPPIQANPLNPIDFKGATFQGRLTSGSVGSMVFLTSTRPVAEVITGYPFPNMQRICNAYGSMVKLSPNRAVREKD